MRTFPASLLKPTTIPEVQEAVLYAAPGVGDSTRVRPVAGRSKTALHHAGDGVVVDVAGLTGITEYQPDECTFTALAGTPVAEIERRLAERATVAAPEPEAGHAPGPDATRRVEVIAALERFLAAVVADRLRRQRVSRQ